MTEAFAGAVTVSIPIFALAAGTEARSLRDRLKRPDQEWERQFAAYQADHKLDVDGPPAEAISYFRDLPGLSKRYLAGRVMAIASAIVWLAVFVVLTIAEIRCLIWLADGARPGDPGLAMFSVVSVALAMVSLIVAPAMYLAMPLMLPFDVIPQGLKDAVGPKLASDNGRGFVKQVFTELEGALERVGEKGQQPESGQHPGDATDAGQKTTS
ncbi:MAG: hypothetical protein LBV34_21930 [Nocardiopsaceae bacterium]|nr:hypothetical protein [Nocardiopsaceae bacterium]